MHAHYNFKFNLALYLSTYINNETLAAVQSYAIITTTLTLCHLHGMPTSKTKAFHHVQQVIAFCCYING